MSNITEIGRVIIPVSDQERSLEFYVGTLGFEKRMDVPMGNDYRWLEVAPVGAPTAIAIVPPPPDPDATKPGVDTGISLTSDDVDAVHADLLARGVDVDAEVTRWGDPVPPMFSFRDPDGNALRVVQRS